MDIQAIETAIQQGRFFHAHNLANEATKQFPGNLRIRQLLGLSMSKSGAKNAALDYLNEIYQKGHDDPETSGILAGVYKDVFKMTSDPSNARKSLEIYQRNFDKEKN
jgi:predicted Zn-dependent protease